MGRKVKFKVGQQEYEMERTTKYCPWMKLTEEEQDKLFINEMKKSIKSYNQKLASEKRKKTKEKIKDTMNLFSYYETVKKHKGLLPKFHDEILLPELEEKVERIKAEDPELVELVEKARKKEIEKRRKEIEKKREEIEKRERKLKKVKTK